MNISGEFLTFHRGNPILHSADLSTASGSRVDSSFS